MKKLKDITISVIGMGYIGLPTAALFANHGLTVIGVDTKLEVVEKINNGRFKSTEPGLETLVNDVVANGALRAVSSPEPADVFLIAVPTPLKSESRGQLVPDLSFLQDACRSVSRVLKRGDLIMIESTAPVGTTEDLLQMILDLRPDLKASSFEDDDANILISYCPERVLPGQILSELVTNDRIIGGISNKASSISSEIYRVFVEGDLHITDCKTAEMVKLTENASRDVQIAFANELSLICDQEGIDVWRLIYLANKHPRVNILQPGPGVGGHCIAVDPMFIVNRSITHSKLIQQAREVNNFKPIWVLEKVRSLIDEYMNANPEILRSDVVIACYGLAFKPNIDDLRESPAMFICEQLAEDHPGSVMAVEPNVTQLPEHLVNKIELINFDLALITANIHILLVDHKEFYENMPDREDIALRTVDTRGIWR